MNYCPERPLKDTCTLKVTITPHFNADSADRLSIHLVLQNPRCAAHHPIFFFETYCGNVPAHHYDENSIIALDAAGPLHLHFTKLTNPDGPDQEWRVDRDTVGDVQLRFSVSPRNVDITTPIGPRVDLRRDQGGLIGNGQWFLPRPAKDRVYRNVVEWDLSRAPEGTSAVWSFGEGPGPVIKNGGPTVIADSVFMVGPIRSYPGASSSSADSSGATVALSAKVFWFGELPENLQRLNRYNILLFPKLVDFFQSAGASYRIFIRRAIRGFGGRGCLESYVLEYDELSWKETDGELVSIFSHEMVHSFSMMGPEIDGYENDWFVEGIAQFYSIYLPYRFGLRGEDYFRDGLNASLQTYGTSPRIGMDVLDSQREFFDDWYAEMIPYMRGCAYLLQIDSRLRKKTRRFGMDQNSPLDDIVVHMAARFRRGNQLQARDWLEYLRPYLGEDVAQEFQDMLRGKPLDLSDNIVIHENWNLTPRMQEILEFGFDKSSINKRVISGVVPESRAANAGLEDGAQLLSMSRAGLCSTSLSTNLELFVEKEGVKSHISYWPRSFNKARVWQLEK
ncbi:hypothetical protein BO71DRAFT_356013 [Aspergillus ellipticus CBS 707.79]|uniref:Peptidase M61 catalytic domain-containing protein n=1 Tax=Aspergillus ellipticus CBS 707.79 TaxID=1448320 RepID=A0A319D6U1_9EURO|nr:hypothetical protein BO71DRAFT_356013 [Aspergillus ellipticus CBS 707.79]